MVEFSVLLSNNKEQNENLQKIHQAKDLWILHSQVLTTPRVGLEPTTLRLTAECSTIELSRITFWYFFRRTFKIAYMNCNTMTRLGQALTRLVTVSSVHYCTSTSALSTSSSSRGLTTWRYGISHLEGGFTLRCLQRLSRPGLATLLCLW